MMRTAMINSELNLVNGGSSNDIIQSTKVEYSDGAGNTFILYHENKTVTPDDIEIISTVNYEDANGYQHSFTA